MKKHIMMITLDSAKWQTAKIAIVAVESDSPWVNTYARDAFDLACARLHIAREDCVLVDYTLLPDDTLFVNCGDYL